MSIRTDHDKKQTTTEKSFSIKRSLLLSYILWQYNNVIRNGKSLSYACTRISMNTDQWWDGMPVKIQVYVIVKIVTPEFNSPSLLGKAIVGYYWSS